MPLGLLVPAVLIGIALVAFAVWMTGGGAGAELDADRAKARFLQDFPEASVSDVAVSADRRSALLWLGSGCGVVFVVGDRFATRRVPLGRVRHEAEGFSIDFDDYATPRLRVAVDAPGWRERLGA
jgi:hypothetical protein